MTDREKAQKDINDVLRELNKIYDGRYKFNYTEEEPYKFGPFCGQPLRANKPIVSYNRQELLDMVKDMALIVVGNCHEWREFAFWKARRSSDYTRDLIMDKTIDQMQLVLAPAKFLVEQLAKEDMTWVEKYKKVTTRKTDCDNFLGKIRK